MTNVPSSPFSLAGKVALITGGAMGIGRAIGERFLGAGAKVVLLDRDERALEETKAALTKAGAQVAVVHADVRKVEDIDRAVSTAVGTFGGLHVLVNNAGVFPMTPVLDITEAGWDTVLDVNLKGAFLLAQRAAREMVKQKSGGVILNIASIDGLHPSGALVHYDASKGGLIMMTRSLALELGPHGIRVNGVAPGAIDTPGARTAMGQEKATSTAAMEKALSGFVQRVPLGRMGRPDDIALPCLFLASDAAAYVTGATLVVDGGYLLS